MGTPNFRQGASPSLPLKRRSPSNPVLINGSDPINESIPMSGPPFGAKKMRLNKRPKAFSVKLAYHCLISDPPFLAQKFLPPCDPGGSVIFFGGGRVGPILGVGHPSTRDQRIFSSHKYVVCCKEGWKVCHPGTAAYARVPPSHICPTHRLEVGILRLLGTCTPHPPGDSYSLSCSALPLVWWGLP